MKIDRYKHRVPAVGFITNFSLHSQKFHFPQLIFELVLFTKTKNLGDKILKQYKCSHYLLHLTYHLIKRFSVFLVATTLKSKVTLKVYIFFFLFVRTELPSAIHLYQVDLGLHCGMMN